MHGKDKLEMQETLTPGYKSSFLQPKKVQSNEKACKNEAGAEKNHSQRRWGEIKAALSIIGIRMMRWEEVKFCYLRGTFSFLCNKCAQVLGILQTLTWELT